MSDRYGRNSKTWKERWLDDLDTAARGGMVAGVWFVVCLSIIGAASGTIAGIVWAFVK